ncbi:Porphobilinogen deaminase [Pseudonocardia sp. Ae406_Ps2]|uniref:hydroxymethylbilane synthase n=1 Tax=unclassified Pseudonocardia TaxID=2619320 RepID=UPI0002E538C1|nr:MULTISPECIES: hydroxymethylbilane synthase [unclassified Pseudonocardia]OLL97805.1 Porphobilinogen deaminase [Pseudonocardia sp. Ae331_Ps2]OLM04483.1 Porphobilinogen deaminase [Pseudonocardia sp. Ae406_Ps2]OLM10683.1 Porphobilinogen deaminase [Pseudonocardia sp. Ae505_Ps2]OLM26046.1 Porphobilinogen deaminase [Pseudonocardia sp. Ae706_Ps2]OLM33830.1 Porphobilinogen deaminase [Pseudonocardia sp. Ae717_Ps2]
MSVLKIGTRPSKLAVAQSTTVADRLVAAGHPCELVTISTSGDRSSAPIPQIGVGVFVSQLRDALYAGEIDVAVHSYKDLPSAQPEGLTIAAVPEREDVRDALVTGGRVLGELGRGARVGTGSPRRTVQLHALGLGLEVLPIRGNVDTRIGKVRSGELDAVVVAAAGLRRLGRVDEADELIDPLQMLPAPAQGALAIECRTADTDLAAVLAAVLDDSGVRFAVTAERAVLAGLEAECTTPVGALAEVVSDLDDDGRAVDRLSLRGALGIGDIAGGDVVRASATGDMDDAEKIGAAVALELLDLGAEDLRPAGPGGPANR